MGSSQLITEISRIKEMMGITEDKKLLKESVGDEIVEILVKFLRKDISELTSLGVRNADDLKKLMDDFLDPAVSAANKVDVLKLILDDLGQAAINSIAKESVEDVTSGVGKFVNDRMASYIDAYKKGVVTYDEVITQLQDDLTKLMSKSSDELTQLKQALNDEALTKAKFQLDDVKGAVNDGAGSIDDEFEQLMKNNEKVKKVLDKFKKNENWVKLDQRRQTLIEQFVEANKDMDYITLMAKTDDFMKKQLMESVSPTLFKKIWTKWKTLKSWQKWSIGIALMSGAFAATDGTALCAVRGALDWVGENLGVLDLEDQEAWNRCEWGVDPDGETNSECPGESAFKSAIETAYGGDVDNTKYGTFDVEKCAGMYDGETYTWDNNVKEWI